MIPSPWIAYEARWSDWKTLSSLVSSFRPLFLLMTLTFLTGLVALIERAQFALNKCIYNPGTLEFKGATGDKSFLEYFLWETEKVHGKLHPPSIQQLLIL